MTVLIALEADNCTHSLNCFMNSQFNRVDMRAYYHFFQLKSARQKIMKMSYLFQKLFAVYVLVNPFFDLINRIALIDTIRSLRISYSNKRSLYQN